MNITPFYLLIDTSASMFGEGIKSISAAVEAFFKDLYVYYNDSSVLGRASVCIITFSDTAQIEMPMMMVDEDVFDLLPKFAAFGNTSMGGAIGLLNECLLGQRRKEFNRANVLLVTDGFPTDKCFFEKQLELLDYSLISNFVAGYIGPKNEHSMKYLTELTRDGESIVTLPSYDEVVGLFSDFVKYCVFYAQPQMPFHKLSFSMFLRSLFARFLGCRTLERDKKDIDIDSLPPLPPFEE